MNSRGGSDTDVLHAKTKEDNAKEFQIQVAKQLRVMLELDRYEDLADGISETPERVTRMWLEELTAGYNVDIASLFRDFEDEGHHGQVIVDHIPVRSCCEHHLVPIVGYAHIGYFPSGRIIGLSKFHRLVDAFSRRLQVQERLTRQIVDAIEEHLSPRGTMVVIEAEHFCMTLRGVQAPGSRTVTSTATGMYADEQGTKDEFLTLFRNGGSV